MQNQYAVKVTVLDAKGNEVFTLNATASAEQLMLPGHVTPGLATVAQFLTELDKPQG